MANIYLIIWQSQSVLFFKIFNVRSMIIKILRTSNHQITFLADYKIDVLNTRLSQYVIKPSLIKLVRGYGFVNHYPNKVL